MLLAAELEQAQSLLRAQKVREAWNALLPLLAREQSNREALLLAGRIQLALDDVGAAKKFLRGAVAIDSGYFPAQFLLGFCLYVDNDFTPALSALETARKLKPGDGATLLYLALTYEGLADPVKALEVYPLAVRLHTSAEAPLAYARLLYNLGRFDEAQKLVSESLRRDSKYREAHYEQARLYFEAGRNAQCVASGELALQLPGLEQTLRPIHHLLSRAYQRLGKAEEAQKHRDVFEKIPPRLIR